MLGAGWGEVSALVCREVDFAQDLKHAAFKGSPMKRGTLRGLKRNAAVVRGYPATAARADSAAVAGSPHEAGRGGRGHGRASSHGFTVNARMASRKRASDQSGSSNGLQPIHDATR